MGWPRASLLAVEAALAPQHFWFNDGRCVFELYSALTPYPWFALFSQDFAVSAC